MNRRGVSVIELLVSLSCFALLLGAIGTALTHSLVTTAKLSEVREAVSALSRTEALLGEALWAYDSTRLAYALRVHPGGFFSLTNGAAHPLNSSRFAPDPRSDAITALELSPAETLAVLSATPSSGAYEFLACSAAGRLPPAAERDHFLGLGPETQHELLGSGKLVSGRPNCLNLTLRDQTSVIVPQSVGDRSYVTTLIPIRRIFSLYLDNSSQLRFVSHEGGRTTENQPLLRGLSQLKLELQQPISGVGSITATISSGSRKAELALISRLTRETPYNLIGHQGL